MLKGNIRVVVRPNDLGHVSDRTAVVVTDAASNSPYSKRERNNGFFNDISNTNTNRKNNGRQTFELTIVSLCFLPNFEVRKPCWREWSLLEKKKSRKISKIFEELLRLQNKLSQIPESEQTAEVREKIFKKVIGDEKRGRVLTYGHGPSFKDVFGKDSECLTDIAIRRAQEKENATNELLREELAATKMLVAHIGLMYKRLLMMDVLLLVDYSKVNDQKDAQLDETSKGKDDEAGRKLHVKKKLKKHGNQGKQGATLSNELLHSLGPCTREGNTDVLCVLTYYMRSICCISQLIRRIANDKWRPTKIIPKYYVCDLLHEPNPHAPSCPCVGVCLAHNTVEVGEKDQGERSFALEEMFMDLKV
ncbi:hypothetical protein Scep_029737 [Stephania cephalantha]|uniref:Uncharacterized protein n=1 Tax=Stephania cephalantha TaxID=152367 RepID=A0AAP0HG94_9MAGN